MPRDSGAVYIPPEMELVDKDTGLEIDSGDKLLLFKRSFKYGAGCSVRASFFIFSEPDILSEQVSESGFWEGGYYRKPFINFPKACYDVYEDKWVSHTTKNLSKGNIIVTVQEKKYEDGKEVYFEDEYNPGR